MRTYQEILDYLKAYRIANADRISQQKKDWYNKNILRERFKRREAYKLNKQVYIDRARAWALENPIKMKASRKQWRLNNTDLVNSYGNNYRAKKHGLISEPYNPLIVYERDGGKCGICRQLISKIYRFPDSRSLTIDHIIPISKGGPDILGNIQIAHFGCNSRKKDYVQA